MKILRFLINIKVIYINADNFIKLWQRRKPYQNKESISGNLKPLYIIIFDLITLQKSCNYIQYTCIHKHFLYIFKFWLINFFLNNCPEHLIRFITQHICHIFVTKIHLIKNQNCMMFYLYEKWLFSFSYLFFPSTPLKKNPEQLLSIFQPTKSWISLNTMYLLKRKQKISTT